MDKYKPIGFKWKNNEEKYRVLSEILNQKLDSFIDEARNCINYRNKFVTNVSFNKLVELVEKLAKMNKCSEKDVKHLAVNSRKQETERGFVPSEKHIIEKIEEIVNNLEKNIICCQVFRGEKIVSITHKQIPILKKEELECGQITLDLEKWNELKSLIEELKEEWKRIEPLLKYIPEDLKIRYLKCSEKESGDSEKIHKQVRIPPDGNNRKESPVETNSHEDCSHSEKHIIEKIEEIAKKHFKEGSIHRYNDVYVGAWKKRINYYSSDCSVCRILNSLIKQLKPDCSEKDDYQQHGDRESRSMLEYGGSPSEKHTIEKLPEKCADCGGMLNLWTGSHTCVRIATLKKEGHRMINKVRWICTNCFMKIMKGESDCMKEMMEFDIKGRLIKGSQMDVLVMKKHVKKPIPIQVFQVKKPFLVHTMERVQEGKANDYLLIGIRGEAYCCDREIFEESYDSNIKIKTIKISKLEKFIKKWEKMVFVSKCNPDGVKKLIIQDLKNEINPEEGKRE